MSEPCRRSTGARRRYLDAGMAVLAEQGYPGLKLATVCRHLGTTTGSFYHAFESWPEFQRDLIAHWRQTESDELIRVTSQIADNTARLDALTDVALTLPHATERAIRVWAESDPAVAAVQRAVDADRIEALTDAFAVSSGDRVLARRLACVAMQLLVGYEAGMGTVDDLAWAFATLRDGNAGA
ncbi:TetR/AcrR family transcriptional regulator [Tsukamurella sp. 8F]|uniref:TetR/AcrR family transcriptional regulator n=1 Tax=unclassified Tsukamurella TaxID=2633480 RepID=UPI0023B8FB39|nr:MULTISPECIES: TetR/AcrR family transcriptional regulator [unclassified Tsukamurella]MDF0529068.1 TetR/AcrR family transcriptional regulator [Tsukamurella sp. 8J]MDF0587442.1 TetR/AcrR family transcriptional regulator [Tsukamurella sp. 8F]